MYSHIPLGLNQLLNVGVNHWLQICVVDNCQWVYLLVEGLLCQLLHPLISPNSTAARHPAETDTCASVTQQPEQVHDMADQRVLCVLTLNCLQTGHWVRVDQYIVMDRAHVPAMVQVMAVASAAKMVLLSGNLLESWRQAVSPFWKWRLMTTAAPTLSFIVKSGKPKMMCS